MEFSVVVVVDDPVSPRALIFDALFFSVLFSFLTFFSLFIFVLVPVASAWCFWFILLWYQAFGKDPVELRRCYDLVDGLIEVEDI